MFAGRTGSGGPIQATTNTAGTEFVFVDSGNGVNVQYRATLSGGATYSGNVAFNITKPSNCVSVQAKPSSEFRADIGLLGGYPSWLYYGRGSLGPASEAGIRFVNNCPASGGTFSWIQKVGNVNIMRYSGGPLNILQCNDQLDTSYPYSYNQDTDDSPRTPLSIPSERYTLFEDFSMWLMYSPFPGTPGTPVPVARVDWSLGAEVVSSDGVPVQRGIGRIVVWRHCVPIWLRHVGHVREPILQIDDRAIWKLDGHNSAVPRHPPLRKCTRTADVAETRCLYPNRQT